MIYATDSGGSAPLTGHRLHLRHQVREHDPPVAQHHQPPLILPQPDPLRRPPRQDRAPLLVHLDPDQRHHLAYTAPLPIASPLPVPLWCILPNPAGTARRRTPHSDTILTRTGSAARPQPGPLRCTLVSREAIHMAAMVTVLVTAAGLGVLGVRELCEARDRRAFRRRLRAVVGDPVDWAGLQRIRGVML